MFTEDSNLTIENEGQIDFDELSQDFTGGSFYGLEYVLEDFAKDILQNTSLLSNPKEDWFGLYHL